MSFSGKTKEALCEICNRGKKCCKFAQFYGILLFSNSFNKNLIRFQTENAVVKDFVNSLCKELFDFEFEITMRNFKDEKDLYTLKIEDSKKIKKILASYYINKNDIALRIDYKILSNECCKKAFLRGVFIAGGSITNPQKAYHFEFTTSHYLLSKDLITLGLEIGIEFKSIVRKNTYVLYLKGSENIEDILAILEASGVLFDFMDIKIIKDIRNQTNRLTNCETANITKTINAASIQVKAINDIIKRYGSLNMFEEETINIANLRLLNPEMSLSQIGESLSPRRSRSFVNHRLKKIEKFTKEM